MLQRLVLCEGTRVYVALLTYKARRYMVTCYDTLPSRATILVWAMRGSVQCARERRALGKLPESSNGATSPGSTLPASCMASMATPAASMASTSTAPTYHIDAPNGPYTIAAGRTFCTPITGYWT
jgi:hypothetical protein